MSFRRSFEELFQAQAPSLLRFLTRSSGDPELAADLAQEAFVKLLHRGSLPDDPPAWLFTVGLNLLRNARATAARRGSLLSTSTAEAILPRPLPGPAEAWGGEETRMAVRAALEILGEREKSLLLLRAEGLSYRELARTLDLNEASVGTLLARARKSFKDAYQEVSRAPR